ncbi:MAG: hypothetical protein ABSH16_05270 [Sedimentisphaerales bacterium]
MHSHITIGVLPVPPAVILPILITGTVCCVLSVVLSPACVTANDFNRSWEYKKL